MDIKLKINKEDHRARVAHTLYNEIIMIYESALLQNTFTA